MTAPTEKKSSIENALAASIFFHLAAFGAVAAMQPGMPKYTIKEYIQVDLAQLPPMPRYVAATPAAAAPRLPKPAPPAMAPEKPAPAPPPVAQKVAALPAPTTSAPVTGPTIPARAPAATVTGATGKGQPGSIGTGAPLSHPGTGATAPGIRDKGDYLAFHRLSKLPSFRVHSEPVYPNAERMSGAEARVLAEIYLDERGAVDDVVIKKSGGRLFDKAVIEAIRQSSFHPGYMGEKAVPTVIQIPYSFKLR
ncbi:MAG: energy transducer TonB [Desulfuromonadaceae bacterium]|nr:energy transducer TonB [Desulfuromonadaceae bacterium]